MPFDLNFFERGSAAGEQRYRSPPGRLETQVRQLSDIEAVRQLRHRYHQCIADRADD